MGTLTVPVAQNLTTFSNDDGLEYVKKMMMTEYMEYEETMTCVHKVEKRCSITRTWPSCRGVL